MKMLMRLLILALFAAVSLHAQTTYTLGTAFCSPHEVACYQIPLNGNPATTVDISLEPYQNPTSSRYISGIPGITNGWALPYLDSTYHVAYTTATYTTRDGKTWTAQVPETITLTWIQLAIGQDQYGWYTYIPPNALTGSATIELGAYYYVDTCSGRGCGGVIGWHWSTVGESITVN